MKEAQSAFKKKYTTEWFTIAGPFREYSENAFDGQEIHTIKNFDVARQFLRAFGKYIESIGVNLQPIIESEAKEIVKYINDICFDSTSLKRLSLEGCVGGVLDELNNTFSSVETLWFSSGTFDRSIEIRPNARKLADIFPNAKTLHLDNTAPSDWELIGKTFPNLSDLQVTLKPFSDETTNLNVQVIRFLKDNSEISKLSIEYSNLKFLKEINDILPKLQNLDLGTLWQNYQNNHSDPIQFKQVETLTIRSIWDHVYPDQLHFDQLQELDLVIGYEFNDKWTEFIHNQINGNLTTLNLITGTLTNDQFLAIVEKKPHLIEAKIAVDSNISADTIITFIKSSEHLRRLHLTALMSQVELQQLQDEIGNDWDIRYFGRFPSKNNVVVSLTKKETEPKGNGSNVLDMNSTLLLTICLIYVIAKKI